MKKILIMILALLVPFQTYTMFSFWFNDEKSIEHTKQLKTKAISLLQKNRSNTILNNYLESIKTEEISRSNYSKISAALKTLLFPLNTHIPERLTHASSQNVSSRSWFNPLTWSLFGDVQQRTIAVINEIPEIVDDASTSLKFSDTAVALGALFVADSIVRRNSDNLIFTLCAMPLYVIVPLTTICLKKCRFDMYGILQQNHKYLDEQNRQILAREEELSNQNTDLYQNILALTAQQIDEAARAQERIEELTRQKAKEILSKFVNTIRYNKEIERLHAIYNQESQTRRTNQDFNEIDDLLTQSATQSNLNKEIKVSSGSSETGVATALLFGNYKSKQMKFPIVQSIVFPQFNNSPSCQLYMNQKKIKQNESQDSYNNNLLSGLVISPDALKKGFNALRRVTR